MQTKQVRGYMLLVPVPSVAVVTASRAMDKAVGCRQMIRRLVLVFLLFLAVGWTGISRAEAHGLDEADDAVTVTRFHGGQTSISDAAICRDGQDAAEAASDQSPAQAPAHDRCHCDLGLCSLSLPVAVSFSQSEGFDLVRDIIVSDRGASLHVIRPLLQPPRV